MIPGATRISLPYRARVVPERMLYGVTPLTFVGVTGAVSSSVSDARKVMEEGVSPSSGEEGKEWRVRLYLCETFAARVETRDFAMEGCSPMLMRWLTIAVVRSGRAFTFTPPEMTSTATEVVIRYFIPGEALAASRARGSFFAFLVQGWVLRPFLEDFGRSFFSFLGKEGE